MLPLSLLNAAQGQPMMVELKSGETLNGHLVNCDTWMNLTLKEVVQTSADGKSFLKIPEMYVRGSTIKYMRVPEEILDHIKEDRQARNIERNNQRYNNNRGGNNRNYNRQGYNRQGGGGGGGNYNNQNQGGNRDNNYRNRYNRNQNQNQDRNQQHQQHQQPQSQGQGQGQY